MYIKLLFIDFIILNKFYETYKKIKKQINNISLKYLLIL